jgi:hypothetical protein
VPVVYNFFDWGGGLVSRGFRKLAGTEHVEDVPEEEQLPKDKPQAVPPTKPTPQPGSAISLNPPAPEPGPDAA